MEKSIHSTQYAAFLKVLRQTRRRAGLTQIQLAKKIDETQTFVSKCERGERRIDVVELWTFCQAFGVPLRQFVMLFEKGHRAFAEQTGETLETACVDGTSSLLCHSTEPRLTDGMSASCPHCHLRRRQRRAAHRRTRRNARAHRNGRRR
jgi:transcriptional regulator with XRE-family HTH domain